MKIPTLQYELNFLYDLINMSFIDWWRSLQPGDGLIISVIFVTIFLVFLYIKDNFIFIKNKLIFYPVYIISSLVFSVVAYYGFKCWLEVAMYFFDKGGFINFIFAIFGGLLAMFVPYILISIPILIIRLIFFGTKKLKN
jgi:hypothetical protein